jgi:uncharacterized protein YnzC (UPF0291/DUF896 family)
LNSEHSDDKVVAESLTDERNDRLYRQERLNALQASVKKLVETYKVMDDSQDYQILDRKTREEQQVQELFTLLSV